MSNDSSIVVSSAVAIEKKSDPRWVGLTYERDEHNRLWTYDEDGRLICGAKTKSGAPCRKSPIKSRNRCRLHGGASLKGAAHPNAKHLRYSTDIVGKQLLTRYEQAMHDPELMDMRHDIAVTEARIGELLGGLETGESLKAWTAVRKSYDNFVECHNKGDSAGAVYHLQEMGRLIKFGIDRHAKWREVESAQNHKRKLTEAEHKRQSDLKQMMTHEQAMNLLMFAINVVKRRVLQYFPNEKGQELMAAISTDISREMSQRQSKVKRRQADEGED